MIKLNVVVEVSEENYEFLMINLKDVSGCVEKKDLEEFISSGLEYDIENNSSMFLLRRII